MGNRSLANLWMLDWLDTTLGRLTLDGGPGRRYQAASSFPDVGSARVHP